MPQARREPTRADVFDVGSRSEVHGHAAGVPRGFDGSFGHGLAKQAIARDMEHVAGPDPRRIELGRVEQCRDARIGGHRPLTIGVAKRDDDATAAVLHRAGHPDAVTSELGRGELA